MPPQVRQPGLARRHREAHQRAPAVLPAVLHTQHASKTDTSVGRAAEAQPALCDTRTEWQERLPLGQQLLGSLLGCCRRLGGVCQGAPPFGGGGFRGTWVRRVKPLGRRCGRAHQLGRRPG